MPLIRCSHCGEDTFTIMGWADLDHCASCGEVLVSAESESEGDVPRTAASAATTEPAPCSAPMPTRERGHTVTP